MFKRRLEEGYDLPDLDPEYNAWLALAADGDSVTNVLASVAPAIPVSESIVTSTRRVLTFYDTPGGHASPSSVVRTPLPRC